MGDVKWKRRRWEEQQLQKVWTCKNFELCIGKISHAPFDKSWLGLAHLLSSYHIVIITVQQTSLTSYVTLMAWLRNSRRSPVRGDLLISTRNSPKLVQQVSFIYRFFDSFSSLSIEIMYVMCVRFVFWFWGNLMNFVALKGHEDILFKLRNTTPFV